jgi:predicted DNA-binding transcriptional regulator AlpA
MRHTKQRLWELLGISRATWYRHGKPDGLPNRTTQAEMATRYGWSVRTIQRMAKKHREKEARREREKGKYDAAVERRKFHKRRPPEDNPYGRN